MQEKIPNASVSTCQFSLEINRFLFREKISRTETRAPCARSPGLACWKAESRPSSGTAACVDQRHRVRDVAGLAALRRDRGIGARIPRAADELDRLRWISAGDHRPQHVVEIGDVDVVVAH
jgi:hypothetical protein